VRLDLLERFVRLEPRRLAPPVAGAGAGVLAAGGALAAGADAATGVGAFPNPNKLDTEFNRVPLAPLDISTLAQ
jgi:hypothetical protein